MYKYLSDTKQKCTNNHTAGIVSIPGTYADFTTLKEDLPKIENREIQH